MDVPRLRVRVRLYDGEPLVWPCYSDRSEFFLAHEHWEGVWLKSEERAQNQ